MSKRGSSRRWLREHHADGFVADAREAGYRARSVYKLAEVDRRDRVLHAGMTVVDLGASPGGWSQYARERVGADGRVVALDRLPMKPLAGVDFIQGDFREDAVLDWVLAVLQGCDVRLVLSDMSPNIVGIKAVDQPRMMHLAELAAELAERVLVPGGTMLVKVFQGEGFPAFLQDLRGRFARVDSRKPEASRARSRELYLLAKGYGV